MAANPEYVYALYNFEAENPDEVSFKVGERVLVIEKDDAYGDGWFQGTNIRGETGLFPFSYTTYDQPVALKMAQNAAGAAASGNKQAPGDQQQPGVVRSTMADIDDAITELHGKDAAAPHDTARDSFAAGSQGTDADVDEEEANGVHDFAARSAARAALAQNARLSLAELQAEQQDEPWKQDGGDLFERETARAERERALQPSSAVANLEMSDESEDEGDGLPAAGGLPVAGDAAQRAPQEQPRPAPAPADSAPAEPAQPAQTAPDATHAGMPQEAALGAAGAAGAGLGAASLAAGEQRAEAVPQPAEPLPAQPAPQPAPEPTSMPVTQPEPAAPPAPEPASMTVTQPEPAAPPAPAMPEPSAPASAVPAELTQPNEPLDRSESTRTFVSAEEPSVPGSFFTKSSPEKPRSQLAEPAAKPPAPAGDTSPFMPTPDADTTAVAQGVSDMNVADKAADTTAPVGTTTPPVPPAVPEPVRTEAPAAPEPAAAPGGMPAAPEPAAAPGGMPAAAEPAAAPSGVPAGDPTLWSVQDVVAWAQHKGYDQTTQDKLLEHEISGDALLAMDINLLKEIDIHAFGRRFHLANGIKELRTRVPGAQVPAQGSPMQAPPSAGPVPLSPAATGSPAMSMGTWDRPDVRSSQFTETWSPGAQPSPMFNSIATGSYSATTTPNPALGSTGTTPFMPAVPSFPQESREPAPVPAGGLGPGGLAPVAVSPTTPQEPGLRSAGAQPEWGATQPEWGAPAQGAAPEPWQAPGQELAAPGGAELQTPSTPAAPTTPGAPELAQQPGFPPQASEFAAPPQPGFPPQASEFAAPPQPEFAPPPQPEFAPPPQEPTGPAPAPAAGPEPELSERLAAGNKGFSPIPATPQSDASPRKSQLSGTSWGRTARNSIFAPRKAPKTPFDAQGPAAGQEPPPRAHSGPLSFLRLQRNSHMPPAQPSKEQISLPTSNTNFDAAPAAGAAGGAAAGATDPASMEAPTGLSVLSRLRPLSKEGWIKKKGERYNTWNTRYLALKGADLIVLRDPSAEKIKGYIRMRGYKVVADENTNPGKYGFKLVHETERTHYFSMDDAETMRDWMKVLMKSTIDRDTRQPVVSSYNNQTVSLEEAQRMRPRPPSPTSRARTQREYGRENTNQLTQKDAEVLMGLPNE